MLTATHLATLQRKFKADEHEFLRGFCYITEAAITERMDEVDPAWTFAILDKYTRDNQAVVVARLTILNASRDGVGMQPLTITVKGEVKENPSEPEKGAATDALKRAARLFGVGRYLLTLPDSIKDVTALAAWLNTSTSRWSKADCDAFILDWRKQGLSDHELLTALNITRWGEWNSSRAAADAAVNRWIEARMREGVQE